ncbi:hypothetical protein Tco_1448651 [Tanacetum coccineum]
MSDSEDSIVTYTEVSSPFEDLSDIGSPGVDGLPMMLEDPYVEAALQAPPYPDYILGPEHPPSPIYEQPLPAAVSPTAESPGYIADSNLEKDEEDPEDDPADYPADKGDDDESSNDDGDEEGEEEHLAPTNSVPPPVHRVTARMSIRAQTPISLPPRAKVERLLALPTQPPSPLTPLSSPLP